MSSAERSCASGEDRRAHSVWAGVSLGCVLEDVFILKGHADLGLWKVVGHGKSSQEDMLASVWRQ